MTITRAKASRLLNQSEMGLYDASRINGLRQLDARALASRIGRARTARDRARDLVQRQKLASRSRTGSKRGNAGTDNQRSKDKAELLGDILKRFETRLREVEREHTAASPRAGTTAKAKPAKKAAVVKAARPRQAEAGTAAGKPTRATKAAKAAKAAKATEATEATKAATPGKTTKAATVKKSAKRAGQARTQDAAPAARKSPARKRRITPEQALAQTHALLEAKQQRDQQPKEWGHLDSGSHAEAGAGGYQSPTAASRALQLHAAESRLPAIQGSSSTRDRISQGKRDRRGQDGE